MCLYGRAGEASEPCKEQVGMILITSEAVGARDRKTSGGRGRLDELWTKTEPSAHQRTTGARPPTRSLEAQVDEHQHMYICVGTAARALLLRRPQFTSSGNVIGEWRYRDPARISVQLVAEAAPSELDAASGLVRAHAVALWRPRAEVEVSIRCFGGGE